MPTRLKLVCLTLILALFYSPLSAVLNRLGGGVIGTGVSETALGLIALIPILTLILRGRLKIPRPGVVDLWMLGWLFYGGIAFLTTYNLHEEIFSTLLVLRYFFVIPFAYFIFRVCVSTSREYEQIVEIYLTFLKVATIYMLIEFAAVNLFGLRLSLELFFSRTGEDFRLYDGVFGAFLKPAGPIHGSQNASLVSLISTFSFAIALRVYRRKSDQIWLLFAIASLCVSFTVTAVIAASAVIYFLGIPIFRGIPKIYSRIIAGFGVIGGFLYRKEILAFRDKGTTGRPSHYYERTKLIIDQSVQSFVDGLTAHPLGTGWPNHLAPKDSPAHQVFDTAPLEIFIFKLGYYLGPFFLIFFLAMNFYFLIRLSRLNRRNPGVIALQFAAIVILGLLISTVHYESFTRTGFSYLYAFCLALVAAYQPAGTIAAQTNSTQAAPAP